MACGADRPGAGAIAPRAARDHEDLPLGQQVHKHDGAPGPTAPPERAPAHDGEPEGHGRGRRRLTRKVSAPSATCRSSTRASRASRTARADAPNSVARSPTSGVRPARPDESFTATHTSSMPSRRSRGAASSTRLGTPDAAAVTPAMSAGRVRSRPSGASAPRRLATWAEGSTDGGPGSFSSWGGRRRSTRWGRCRGAGRWRARFRGSGTSRR